jgi:hypothetical protein
MATGTGNAGPGKKLHEYEGFNDRLGNRPGDPAADLAKN